MGEGLIPMESVFFDYELMILNQLTLSSNLFNNKFSSIFINLEIKRRIEQPAAGFMETL